VAQAFLGRARTWRIEGKMAAEGLQILACRSNEALLRQEIMQTVRWMLGAWQTKLGARWFSRVIKAPL
jgi:hypothetical protein